MVIGGNISQGIEVNQVKENVYFSVKNRNWAYDIRQKFHASYVTVSLSDISTTFTAYVMKPENIYQEEKNQTMLDIYILFY